MKFPILLPNIFNHPFTYESDIKLKVGDFVEVPFGKTKITGVVWNEFEENNSKKFKVKKVINKLDIPSLKKNMLDFLNWFSEYNIVPKGMALKLVLTGGKELKSIDQKFYDSLTLEPNEGTGVVSVGSNGYSLGDLSTNLVSSNIDCGTF